MQDDPCQAFDANAFLDGFAEEIREVPVPANSVLGRTMAEYRGRVATDKAKEQDPDTWKVEPVPVEP